MSAFNTPSNTTDKNIQLQAATASCLTLKRTRWLFFALCCYLLSQSFTIPIFAIGPSWALWPNLSDLATGLLVLTFLLNFRSTSAPSGANKSIFYILVLVLFGCILSFTSYLTWVIDENAPGINIGIYQIYRLVEFVCIFWVTAWIPLPLKRINILSRIVNGVLIFVCTGIILTYFLPGLLGMLTSHLPQSPAVAGPWSSYGITARLSGRGWGTIGYNHAYVAAQVLMLLSLSIHLGLNKALFHNILLVMSICACFLSESRAGMAAMLIFAIVYLLQKPIYAVIPAAVAIFAGIIVPLVAPQSINFTSVEGSIIERQKTLLEAKSPENLSGRAEIWADRISFLDEERIRWLLGAGFGASADSGSSAHMLVLHLILETGLLGLLIFIFLFSKILYYLYQRELGVKPIFWATVAFLVSSLTQETFYPTSAMGHFIGFYLCSLAIALRS